MYLHSFLPSFRKKHQTVDSILRRSIVVNSSNPSSRTGTEAESRKFKYEPECRQRLRRRAVRMVPWAATAAAANFGRRMADVSFSAKALRSGCIGFAVVMGGGIHVSMRMAVKVLSPDLWPLLQPLRCVVGAMKPQTVPLNPKP